MSLVPTLVLKTSLSRCLSCKDGSDASNYAGTVGLLKVRCMLSAVRTGATRCLLLLTMNSAFWEAAK